MAPFDFLGPDHARARPRSGVLGRIRFRFVNHARLTILLAMMRVVLRPSSDVRMLATAALFIFPVLMAYAASSDLLTMRIANWLVALVAVLYFVLALVAQIGWSEIGMAALAAAIVLAVAFAFFAFGWIGGGDAKLVSASTLWVGFGLMLQYLIYAALLGGALTLLILWFRRHPLPPRLAAQKWIDKLHDPKSGVPYGISLAIAAILVYPETQIFRQLIGS